MWLELKRLGGRLESLRRTREKRNPERLFQFVDVTPERRLGQLQSPRRTRKVAFAQHRQERAAQLPAQRTRRHSFMYSDYSLLGNSFLPGSAVRWALSCQLGSRRGQSTVVETVKPEPT